MFTTAYRNNHSSTSFPKRNIRTSTTVNAMTNEQSRFPLRANHLRVPIPPIGEPLSINSTNMKHSASSQCLTSPRHHFNTNESVSVKSSKKIYTFSNLPCELPRYRRSSHSSVLQQRVSSAPDENSPRSRLNQPKSSSANESLTPRLYVDGINPSKRIIDSRNHILKYDEQQKHSLNALIKEQEKSNVPKAVQKRRIVLLFPRSPKNSEHFNSPKNSEHRNSPKNPEHCNPPKVDNDQNRNFPSSSSLIIPNTIPVSEPSDSSVNISPEMADSLQLAAILAEMQLDSQSTSNESSSSSLPKNSHITLDASKYDYVAANALDTATFKLSPRTLKPDEEFAAKKRFAQYHQNEMRESSNAKMPSLIASIVTDNNNTIGNGIDIGQTFTFKFNTTTDTIKKQSSIDADDDAFESTTDSELLRLCYDATLKLLYDPNTGKYYDLSSA
ncbi:unnamed protein product [Adineta steineri]|uniref:Uncharacterized protein n=1 Tax=Adineta steineri TaxID=433720 RepID=A0A813WTS1_9BILA|nr:unnamed protein product [Adineta steineri]CAF0822691.1 unnamed protein product [Adineta steineri]CAF0863164.1 unnamed protein product [Adineta steineri]